MQVKSFKAIASVQTLAVFTFPAAAAAEPVLHSRLTTPPRDFRPEALTAAVRTLEDGKVYYLTNNLTFEGTAPGESGLAVASNATSLYGGKNLWPDAVSERDAPHVRLLQELAQAEDGRAQ